MAQKLATVRHLRLVIDPRESRREQKETPQYSGQLSWLLYLKFLSESAKVSIRSQSHSKLQISGVMANVELMPTMQRLLFKFAFDYKRKQVELGRDTPILNALIFKKTAALLGGNMRAMLSGGAPLEVKTQRFIEICIRSPLVIGLV